MFEIFKSIRIKTFCNTLIVVMFASGATIGVIAMLTIQNINYVDKVWEKYTENAVAKTGYLGDLRQAIGYGGIHYFLKNYMLRDEQVYYEGAQRSVREAKDAINNYRKTGATAPENEALNVIETKVSRYLAKLAQIRQMHAQNIPSVEIDAALRESDSETINAIETLLRVVATERATSRQIVSSAVKSAQDYIYVMVGSIIVLIFISIFMFLWFARNRLISPIYTLVDYVNQVGKGDLTRNVEVVSNDEVGTLAARLNEMVANLKEIAVQTREAVGNLNSSSSETLASTQQQAASVAEQYAAIQETTLTLEEIFKTGEQMSSRATEVAKQAERASDHSKDGLRSVDDMAKVMDGIEEQTEAVADQIVALSEKTQTISDIIAKVTDVAERSQLLALNAAIEAAAAGEQGRSFSVVADEIKALADQAKGATAQVSSILTEIQKGINSSVMTTEESVKRVSRGRQQSERTQRAISELAEIIEVSVQAFEQIVASTSQQRVGIQQVSKALQQIRDGSAQTAAGTKQIEQAVSNITSLGSELDHAMERYAV